MIIVYEQVYHYLVTNNIIYYIHVNLDLDFFTQQ